MVKREGKQRDTLFCSECSAEKRGRAGRLLTRDALCEVTLVRLYTSLSRGLHDVLSDPTSLSPLREVCKSHVKIASA